MSAAAVRSLTSSRPHALEVALPPAQRRLVEHAQRAATSWPRTTSVGQTNSSCTMTRKPAASHRALRAGTLADSDGMPPRSSKIPVVIVAQPANDGADRLGAAAGEQVAVVCTGAADEPDDPVPGGGLLGVEGRHARSCSGRSRRSRTAARTGCHTCSTSSDATDTSGRWCWSPGWRARSTCVRRVRSRRMTRHDVDLRPSMSSAGQLSAMRATRS